MSVVDPELARDLTILANDTEMRRSYLALLLANFLNKCADRQGLLGRAILRGLAVEIEDAAE